MEETLIKRSMPNSLDAEQSVIGSMIMDKDAILTVPRRRKRQHASPHHPRRLLPDGLGPRHEPLQCLHAPQVRRQAPRRGRRDHAHRTRAHAHPKREGPRHPPCDDLENP